MLITSVFMHHLNKQLIWQPEKLQEEKVILRSKMQPAKEGPLLNKQGHRQVLLSELIILKWGFWPMMTVG